MLKNNKDDNNACSNWAIMEYAREPASPGAVAVRDLAPADAVTWRKTREKDVDVLVWLCDQDYRGHERVPGEGGAYWSL